jgi:protein SCO1
VGGKPGRWLRSNDVNPRVLIALFLLAVFALAATVLAARGDDGGGEVAGAGSRFEGAVMPADLRAPDFKLRNQDGETISMRDFRGKPVLVTFLYTTCDDTCPIQAQTARGALDQLGHDVPAIAIAVDPPRDTPERARAFLSEQRAIGRLDFVLGTRAQLRPLWRKYGIRPQSLTQEHQARFTLVDPRGFQRVGYPGSLATPEGLAHDLRLLEREG